jgi:hypothetical protein
MTPGAWAIRHLICLVTPIINIYGLGVGMSTVKKFWAGRGWGLTPGLWTTMHLIRLVTPLPAQYFLTVDIPTPKPYIFMIGVTRRIKCIVVHKHVSQVSKWAIINGTMCEDILSWVKLWYHVCRYSIMSVVMVPCVQIFNHAWKNVNNMASHRLRILAIFLTFLEINSHIMAHIEADGHI